MKSLTLFNIALGAACALILPSCGTFGKRAIKPNPNQTVIKDAGYVNPHPPGTYAHFKAGKYPGTTRTWKNASLLAQASPSNTKVKIDLSMQRGFLMVNDQIAMDYRVSSGSSKHKTPTGSFRITEKIKAKRSNLYGRIVSSSGKTIRSGADSRKHKAPKGAKFVGASMPYWMRLTGSGIGMHQGNVGRRYASHGCIRTHSSAVPIVFAKTKVGTPVTVVP